MVPKVAGPFERAFLQSVVPNYFSSGPRFLRNGLRISERMVPKPILHRNGSSESQGSSPNGPFCNLSHPNAAIQVVPNQDSVRTDGSEQRFRPNGWVRTEIPAGHTPNPSERKVPNPSLPRNGWFRKLAVVPKVHLCNLSGRTPSERMGPNRDSCGTHPKSFGTKGSEPKLPSERMVLKVGGRSERAFMQSVVPSCSRTDGSESQRSFGAGISAVCRAQVLQNGESCGTDRESFGADGSDPELPLEWMVRKVRFRSERAFLLSVDHKCCRNARSTDCRNARSEGSLSFGTIRSEKGLASEPSVTKDLIPVLQESRCGAMGSEALLVHRLQKCPLGTTPNFRNHPRKRSSASRRQRTAEGTKCLGKICPAPCRGQIIRRQFYPNFAEAKSSGDNFTLILPRQNNQETILP